MTSPLDLISVNPSGFAGNNASGDIGILAATSFTSRLLDVNADGRYIAFTSAASDLVATDSNNTSDVFVRDRLTGTTTLVSVNFDGTDSGSNNATDPSNRPASYDPVISSDGRYVAFMSYASDLVPNDNNNGSDVFVRDLVTGTTTLVSVNSDGTGSGAGLSSGGSIPVSSYGPVISDDGRYVAFVSYASDLVLNDTNGTISDVFVRDLVMGTTTLVSVNSSDTGSGDRWSLRPVISADGQSIAFTSAASDLVANDPNGGRLDIFVRDLVNGTTTLASPSYDGVEGGNFSSYFSGISDDGRYVLFTSAASNLVSNDTNGNAVDVFVRDVQAGTTTLVSVNADNTGSGNNSYSFPLVGTSAVISANGQYVVFGSSASNLVANDTNNAIDVFVRDLVAGTTTLVSVNLSGTGSGNQASYPAAISDDGRYVVFSSAASDLTENDSNGNYGDIFVRDLVMGTTELIGAYDSNPDRFNTSYLPVISDDGSYIAFSSIGTGLVENDQNYSTDVYGMQLLQ